MRVVDLAGAGEEAERSRVQRAVIAAKRGDSQAVRFLYGCYANKVRRYVTALIGDRDAAEDVMQTTFMKLLTSLDRYQPSEVPFEAWLLRVARNVAFDEARKYRPATTGELEDHPGAETDSHSSALVEALGTLPLEEREVLVLRHVVGLSSVEIAGRLDRSQARVETLHERGRDRLRDALVARGETPVPARVDGSVSSRREQLREARAPSRRRRSVVQIAG